MSLSDLAKGQMGGSGSSLLKGLYQGLSKQLSGVFGPTPAIPGTFPDSNTADLAGIEQELYSLNPMYQVTITYSGESGSVTVKGLLAAQNVDVGVSSSYSPFSESGVLTDQIIKMVGDAVEQPGMAEFGNKVLKLMGIRSIVPQLTSQIWEGTDHINMTVPILFIAEQETDSSGGHSVLKPVTDLMKMAVPKTGEGGFLEPPGPLLQFKGNGVGDQSNENGALANSGSGGLSAIVEAGNNAVSAIKGSATSSSTLVSSLAAGSASVGKSFQENTETINNISISIGQFLTFGSVVITNVNPSLDMTLGGTSNGLSAPMFCICTVSFMSYQIPTDKDIDAMFNQLGLVNYGEEKQSSPIGPFL